MKTSGRGSLATADYSRCASWASSSLYSFQKMPPSLVNDRFTSSLSLSPLPKAMINLRATKNATDWGDEPI